MKILTAVLSRLRNDMMELSVSSLLRKIERIALIVALAVGCFYIKLYNKEVENREIAEIEGRGLPPGILAKYIQQNRELWQAVKNKEGKTIIKKVYVPDEGKIEVITKEREKLQEEFEIIKKELQDAKTEAEVAAARRKLDELLEEAKKPPTVIVTDKGFTSRFGWGLVAGPNLGVEINTRAGPLNIPMIPALDWKWGYYKRWSGVIQINPRYAGPGFTRHVDDITPKFLHMQNLEIGLTGGLEFTGTQRIDVYLRSNF